MKLIASGVANWAAIVRSPSFSRSAASTTTTILPARISSIASSIVANGRSGTGTTLTGSWYERQQPLDVLREHVDLEVDRVARRERAERRLGQRVRDERDREAVVVERGDGQRDAVDGDRALLDAVAEDVRPARRSRSAAPSPSGSTERTRPTPSTWPWTMWPPSGSPARSAGSTLTSSPGCEAAERRAAQRLRDGVERELRRRRRSTTVRQTPSIATESPTATPGAVARASIRRRTPSPSARRRRRVRARARCR